MMTSDTCGSSTSFNHAADKENSINLSALSATLHEMKQTERYQSKRVIEWKNYPNLKNICNTMEGRSVTKKRYFRGMKLFDGDLFKYAEYSCVPWICVEGYNSSLPRTKIEELLRNHFGSCGDFKRIYFHGDSNSCAYLLIYGKGAASNAIKLSGSMMEGNKITVQAKELPLPKIECYGFGSADTVPGKTSNEFVGLY